MNFSKAIVKRPCRAMVNGLKSEDQGPPDFELAVVQHDQYCMALKKCGVQVFILNEDEQYPDSVFVEDTAVLTPEIAIITNPGAPSRKGEITAMKDEVRQHYQMIDSIVSPGTLDGGDVLQIETCFFVGASERTNDEGIDQFREVLQPFGYEVQKVNLKNLLHLKTGCSYLGDQKLILAYELIGHSLFDQYEIIQFDRDHKYAANCLRINDKIIIPSGFPAALKKLENLKLDILQVDMSEFKKLDGGLSCLSLRF